MAAAAYSLPVRERHDADPAADEPVRNHPTIHEIRCKTLLNRVRPPMPFRWSINPYRGCAHACYYCYARPSHITFDMNGGAEFESHIFVKVNAVEVLRAELRRPGWRHEPVTIGTVVDPYQPLEGRYRLTRAILHELAAARTPATIITRMKIGVLWRGGMLAKPNVSLPP